MQKSRGNAALKTGGIGILEEPYQPLVPRKVPLLPEEPKAKRQLVTHQTGAVPLGALYLAFASICGVGGYLIGQIGYSDNFSYFLGGLGTAIGLLLTHFVAANGSREAWNAVPGQAPTEAEGSKTAQHLGCLVGCLAPVLLTMVFWKALYPHGSAEQKNSPPATVDVSKMSSAHKLANINADRILAPDDPAVSEFKSVLNQLRRNFPQNTESQTADQCVATWQQVKRKENISLIEFMRKMATL